MTLETTPSCSIHCVGQNLLGKVSHKLTQIWVSFLGSESSKKLPHGF